MGALTSSTIAATYLSLLKVEGGLNEQLTTTPKVISDGGGIDSKLFLSTDSVLISGSGTKLNFYDDDSEWISADASGNLTINATTSIDLDTPTVDVSGDISIENTNWIGISGSDERLTFYTAGYMSFEGGYLGVGIATPVRQFHVDSGNTNLAVIIEGDDLTQGISVFGDDANKGVEFGNEDGMFYLNTNTTANTGGGTRAFSVAANQRVGIGVTVPQGLLDIKGYANTADAFIRLTRHSSGANAWTIGQVSGELKIGHDSDNDGTTELNAITIDGDGKMGIGATTPVNRLTVDHGTTTATAMSVIGYGGQTTLKLTADDVNTGSAYLLVDATNDGDSGIHISSADTLKWKIFNDYSDSHKLHIVNDDGDGMTMVYGATSLLGTSDERMKENLVELTGAVEKLNTLRCTYYNLKHLTDAPTSIGLIAQDVYKVYPEVTNGNPDDVYEYIKAKKAVYKTVTTQKRNENGEMVDHEEEELVSDEVSAKHKNAMGIRYSELVPVLIKAIQELSTKVEALENA